MRPRSWSFFQPLPVFNGFDKCPDSQGKDESKLAQQYLNAAAKKNWKSLLSAHLADYHRYYDRVKFRLQAPADNKNAALPTDERLVGYTEGARDPSLETMYFQFGRYLLISSSRPGGIAANLQGIWNKELRPPWSSNYTTNINVQMNYWPSEPTNLSEMKPADDGLYKNMPPLRVPLHQNNFIIPVVGRFTTTVIYGR